MIGTREEFLARLAQIERRAMAHGLRPYPFQRTGALHLATSQRCGLWDEMGLGKTVQTVLATPDHVPVLIVCPSSVKHAWAQTYRLWRPEISVRVVAKKADFRWPNPGEVLIVGYEILPPSMREIAHLESEIQARGGAKACRPMMSRLEALRHHRGKLRRPHPLTVLVADEAHRVKNRAAAVTRRFRELAQLVRDDACNGRIWLLTGTPQMNCAEELWTVLQAAGLGVDAFGSEGQYMLDLQTPGVVPKKLRTVSLMRLLEDVLPDLPEKRRETVIVDIDSDTRKLADELVLALRAVGVDIHTATLEAIQTATGTIPRDKISTVKAKLAQAKIPALLEHVEDCEAEGRPLVVFSDHLGPVDAIAARQGWTRVSGRESAAEKQANVDLYQSGKARGIAVSERAGGVGITLTRGNIAVINDYPWVPALVSQVEGRLRRIGSKHSSILYKRLVADHVLEKRIDALILKKQAEIDANVTASAVREGAA